MDYQRRPDEVRLVKSFRHMPPDVPLRFPLCQWQRDLRQRDDKDQLQQEPAATYHNDNNNDNHDHYDDHRLAHNMQSGDRMFLSM